jgi:D-alanyl-D-alanine carboxypeptidase
MSPRTLVPTRALAAGALAAATLALIPAAAASAAATAPADRALGRALTRLVAMRGGPAGAVAVVQRGSKRTVLARGVADRATGRRIAIGDRWRIASVSKAFNGAVALALVARGQLSLDDTIAQRLPGLPAAWGAVTLGQALHHTSGLPDYVHAASFGAAVNAKPNLYVQPETLLSYVADQPLVFAPGSRYEYSDTDNIVVALFAEAATGLSYERLLSELALDPLALRRTSLPLGLAMPAPYVHGYDTEPSGPGEDVTEVLNPTLAWASGGMVSSPLDLNTFVRAYVGGRLFSGATRAAQLQWVPGRSGPPGPGANSAGLGIFRYRTSCGSVYGHTGNIIGYTTFMAASPDGQRSAVVQVSAQLSPSLEDAGLLAVFRALRATEGRAVCAALR